jgi:putative thioredoxin
MILNGEPRPLFQGDQSEEDLKVFVERLIQLAKDQGLDGQLVIGEAPSEPELSEAEAQALDAMDRGDFAAAVKIYEQELQAKPNDETLAERLAQVKLVARTFNLDIEAELAKSPGNLAEAIQKADCLLAIGDAESAFSLVLDFFDSAEDKNQVRSVLLEMFLVAGKNHPATIQARKQLAVKMF